jgi:single-strand DNA-binding protein
MYQTYLAIGNLGADPEMRYTADGKAVTNFRMAINEGYGDRQSTFWVNVVAWEKTAEAVAEYVRKGGLVMIQGRWQMRTWTDKEGNERQTYEVVAHTVKFLSRPKQADGDEEEPAPRTRQEAPAREREERDELQKLPF